MGSAEFTLSEVEGLTTSRNNDDTDDLPDFEAVAFRSSDGRTPLTPHEVSKTPTAAKTTIANNRFAVCPPPGTHVSSPTAFVARRLLLARRALLVLVGQRR